MIGAAPPRAGRCDERLQSHRGGSRELHHRPRVPVQQLVERGLRQPGEVAVAYRDDRRRARLAGEERELADGRAAPRLLEHAHAAVGIVGDRAHAAVHDDVDVVAPVALPEERLASGERDPVELRFDVGERRGVEGAEDLGKRFGELRVARGVQRSVLHRLDDGGCRAAAQVARSHFPSM